MKSLTRKGFLLTYGTRYGPTITRRRLSALSNGLVRPSERHNNVTQHVAGHIGRNLLHERDHPLGILRNLIVGYFDRTFVGADGKPTFEVVDDLHPVVSTASAFDDLLIPASHPSRSFSDTFYVDEKTCLRPHTSAHQNELLLAGKRAFLCMGDVYRRDAIDSSHYPVFHQMEGLYVIPDVSATVKESEDLLKKTLEGMVRDIFGPVEVRWVDAYFPFTEPSFELEILFNNEWLEVLGSGVIHPTILQNCGLGDHKGWAFGLGLERLAMVLFQIPDIRLFWSKDPRFKEQFKEGEISKFTPYSKYPPCFKDISFWLPYKSDDFSQNDFHAVVREVGTDLVESVSLIDEFEKAGRKSHCYRINYRSMDRSLTNAEIDILQERVRNICTTELGVVLR